MLLTNTVLGARQRIGKVSWSGCIVTSNRGPLVREPPSR
jgi:hypothetical protein